MYIMEFHIIIIIQSNCIGMDCSVITYTSQSRHE